VIKSFKHKGIEKLFLYDNRSGINPQYANKILRILDRLDSSTNPQDMNLPGYKLHPLKGTLKGMWSVSISGNWRIIFQFDGNDAVKVDYLDYH